MNAVSGGLTDTQTITVSVTDVAPQILGTNGPNTLNGTTENDTIRGLAGNDRLFGGVEDDTLLGATGNDVLNGGGGADSMQGGAGNDTYFVDNVLDRIVEAVGQGTDNVNASVSYVLAAGVSVETLRTINAAASTAINLIGNSLANTLIGNAGNNVLSGGGGSDTMQGLGGNDTLNGGLGSDTLDGGLGNDRMIGGAGNDTFVVNSIRDALTDFAGVDLVKSTISKTLAAGFEKLTLLGAAAINGTGNAAANIITGNAGNNKLFGLGGSDTINGGARNDVLTGGLGKDTMTGGAGADDFDFNTVAEIGRGASRDIIRDFVHLIDDIDLGTIDANGAAAGNAAFSFLATKGAAFTGTAGELRWFQQNLAGANDRTIIEGDTNGNRVADFQIQLTGLKILTAGDFVL